QGGKTKPTTATYITKEEVDIVNSQGQGIDRNIKTVDIGHENFSVGIIHRGKTVNGVAVPAAGAAASAAAGRGAAAAPAPTPCGRGARMARPPRACGLCELPALAGHSHRGRGAPGAQEVMVSNAVAVWQLREIPRHPRHIDSHAHGKRLPLGLQVDCGPQPGC